MEMHEGLPMYFISIDEDESLGIDKISLVKDPAIEILGMAFAVTVPKGYKRLPPVHPNCMCTLDKLENGKKKWTLSADCCQYCIDLAGAFNNKQNDSGPSSSAPSSKNFSNMEFSVDKDKMEIVGIALRPDFPIYRADDSGEYYVNFSKDTVEKMVERFMSNSDNHALNLDHSSTMVDGYIKESWIVEDPEFDKTKMYGFDGVKAGDWAIRVKITNKEFWKKEVKGNEKYSFSIEGLLGMYRAMGADYNVMSIDEFIDQLSLDEIRDLLE